MPMLSKFEASTPADSHEANRVEQPDSLEDKKIEKLPPSVEDQALSPEAKDVATEQALELMQDVLNDIPDYVVFASTAMYLHGQEKGIDELKVPPGDFDVAVGSLESLKQLRQRLSNVPGVEFDNEGQFKKFKGEDAATLSGEVTLNVPGTGPVRYPFEAFYQSRIVSQDMMQYSEKMHGLNTLSLEGLQKQYLANLQFESKVQQSANEVATFLTNPATEGVIRPKLEAYLQSQSDAEPDKVVSELLAKLDLSAADLLAFYQAKDKFEADNDKASFDSQAAQILTGLKTKLPKRLQNIEELKKSGNIET